MADASPRTDTSTDVDTDDKNQRVIFFALSFFWIYIHINNFNKPHHLNTRLYFLRCHFPVNDQEVWA